MDKTDRETRDFMNVESFSQLPFIRPAPPVVKDKGAAGAIRLFGKEFGCTTADDHSDSSENNNNGREGEATNKDSDDNTDNSISSRKFECHYCCRNFPTSQALGGHQNAHKRERQQAKRAHLQSAIVADSHVYGLMNYTPTHLPMAYHSWNSRLHGNYGGSYNGHHQPQPINGSPLALWRIPAAAAHTSPPYTFERDSPMLHQQIPLFSSENDHMKPLSSITGKPSTQFRLRYESKPDMQDHVSLDLHL